MKKHELSKRMKEKFDSSYLLEGWENPVLIKKLEMKSTIEGTAKRRFALFKCHCGKEFEARLDSVKGHSKAGKSISCGCFFKSASSARMKKLVTTHGESNDKSHIYMLYNRILCRGMLIGSSWDGNYLLFKEWALNNGYSIDLDFTRLDPNKPHDVDNSIFIETKVLTRIRRKSKNNTSGYRGVTWSNASRKWQAQIVADGSSFHIGFFDNPYDAAIAYDRFVINNGLEHTLNLDIWGSINKLLPSCKEIESSGGS